MAMFTPMLVPMVPNAVELAAARVWLTERQWVDADGAVINELSARAVFRAVNAHHDGGWAQFTRDMATQREGWFR